MNQVKTLRSNSRCYRNSDAWLGDVIMINAIIILSLSMYIYIYMFIYIYNHYYYYYYYYYYEGHVDRHLHEQDEAADGPRLFSAARERSRSPFHLQIVDAPFRVAYALGSRFPLVTCRCLRGANSASVFDFDPCFSLVLNLTFLTGER